MLGVATIAAMASYEHAYDLVRAHGESFMKRITPPRISGGYTVVARDSVTPGGSRAVDYRVVRTRKRDARLDKGSPPDWQKFGVLKPPTAPCS